MKLILSKNYILNKDLNLYLDIKYNIFFLKTLLGLFYFYLPSYYFYKHIKNNISFVFPNKFFFKSFIAHFFTNYSNLNNIYIIYYVVGYLQYQFCLAREKELT